MADLIMWLILLVSVVVAISIPFLMKYQKSSSNDVLNDKVGVIKNDTNIKELWKVEDINRGVLKLKGNRYRMVMRLAAADFFLLGEVEQTQVEDALSAVLMGLSYPIQFLITSEAVDTRRAVQEVKERLYEIHPNIQKYAADYAIYLEGLTAERTAAVRSAFAVIPFDTDMGPEYAHTELIARVSSLADGLRACKIQCEILDTPALVDLLQHMLNRGRSWRPSDADSAGVMAMFHVHEREVS